MKSKSAPTNMAKVFVTALVATGQLLPTVALAQGSGAKAPTQTAVESQAPVAPGTGQAGVLNLEGYLEQVKSGNQAYQAATLRTEGADLRSGEYKLLTRPNLIANANYDRNRAQPVSPFAASDTKTTTYSLGIQQTTNFGLTGQLVYQITEIDSNLVPPAGIPIPARYTLATPQFQFTQSLWRNWAGSEIRATKMVQEAAALGTKFEQSYQQIQMMANAETMYWTLALARESIAASKEVLGLSQKSQKWSQNRQRLALVDRADLLQSNAAVLARELDLQSAIDSEKVAARAFNTMRGIDSDVVPESLTIFEQEVIEKLEIPKRVENRADVKAVEQSLRLAEANTRLGRARNTPTVNLVGRMGLNGFDAETSPAVSESWTGRYPNYAIGIQANVPLDIGTINDNRDGYKKEEVAAKVSFQRAKFEQERLWNDLVNRFREASGRLKIATVMEKAQREKVDYERTRHSRGRTTLYNVILFETDFASAQYARIRAQADVLNAYAQLKTFGGNQ